MSGQLIDRFSALRLLPFFLIPLAVASAAIGLIALGLMVASRLVTARETEWKRSLMCRGGTVPPPGFLSRAGGVPSE